MVPHGSCFSYLLPEGQVWLPAEKGHWQVVSTQGASIPVCSNQ